MMLLLVFLLLHLTAGAQQQHPNSNNIPVSLNQDLKTNRYYFSAQANLLTSVSYAHILFNVPTKHILQHTPDVKALADQAYAALNSAGKGPNKPLILALAHLVQVADKKRNVVCKLTKQQCSNTPSTSASAPVSASVSPTASRNTTSTSKNIINQNKIVSFATNTAGMISRFLNEHSSKDRTQRSTKNTTKTSTTTTTTTTTITSTTKKTPKFVPSSPRRPSLRAETKNGKTIWIIHDYVGNRKYIARSKTERESFRLLAGMNFVEAGGDPATVGLKAVDPEGERRRADGRTGSRRQQQTSVDNFRTRVSRHHQEQQRRRRKRQAVIAAAAAISFIAGTATGASVMSMFDKNNINKIKAAVQNLDDREELLAKMINDTAAFGHGNAELIASTINLLTKVNHHVNNNSAQEDAERLAMFSFITLYDHINNLNTLIDIYTTATTSHRLAPAAIDDYEKLTSAFAKAEAEARNKGYRLISNNSLDLFQFETTLDISDGNLLLIVHVPAGLPVATFQMLTYHKIPIILKGKDATHHITIDSPEQILAIPSDPNNKVYLTLNAEDLDACEKYHKNYVCTHLNIHRRMNDLNCLASLYYNRVPDVLRKCKIYIEQPQDSAVMIRHNTFYTYTRKPNRAYMSCNNGTQSSMSVNGYNTITVPNGCTMDLPSIRLVSTAKLPTDIVIDHHIWTIDAFDDILQQMTWSELNESIENLDRSAGGRPTDVKALKTHLMAFQAERARLDTNFEQGGWFSRIAHQILSILTAVIVGGLCFCLCCTCIRNWSAIVDCCTIRKPKSTTTNPGAANIPMGPIIIQQPAQQQQQQQQLPPEAQPLNSP